MRSHDITGKVFSRLTALEFKWVRKGQTYWRCLCLCGKKPIVSYGHLSNGHTKSCGCLLLEKRIKHNHTTKTWKSPEYTTWDGMVQRTTNPNNMAWGDYGGRGITIYPPWRNSFQSFLEYVTSTIGLKPSRKYSIDRIDNNRGYEPGNIRWATKGEQNANRRPYTWR